MIEKLTMVILELVSGGKWGFLSRVLKCHRNAEILQQLFQFKWLSFEKS